MAALEGGGVQLFERGPRGARLTQPGETLFSRAEVALDRLDLADADVATRRRIPQFLRSDNSPPRAVHARALERSI